MCAQKATLRNCGLRPRVYKLQRYKQHTPEPQILGLKVIRQACVPMACVDVHLNNMWSE